MTTAEHMDRVELLIGRRWTAKILMAMLDRDAPMRFGELVAAVPGLSKRLLTERLTELEAAGLVRRDVHASRPVTIEYSLTERGRALHAAFAELRAWAEQQPA